MVTIFYFYLDMALKEGVFSYYRGSYYNIIIVRVWNLRFAFNMALKHRFIIQTSIMSNTIINGGVYKYN